MTSFTVTTLEEVVKDQRLTVETTYSALGSQAPPTHAMGPGDISLHYAVVHHMIEGARVAAQTRDRDAFEWYKRRASESVSESIERLGIDTVVGRRILMSPAFDESDHYLDISSLAMPHALASPPCPLLSTSIPAPTDTQKNVVAKAFELGSSYGFSDLLSAHAAVIVLGPPNVGGEGLTNWTVVNLPGTTYLTDGTDAVLLGREIVHEAGHNWLNDAFEITKSIPDRDAFFFSPWKACMRPAFGFLHACWAFPLTMLFSAAAMESCDEHVRADLSEYLRLQRRALQLAEDDFGEAVRLVRDHRVAEVLQSIFFAARDI